MEDLANSYGQAPCVGWVESLRSSDASQVWRRLHRLVRNHPLVRSSSSMTAAGWAPPDSHEDLTQELFVTLLGKDRFRHYLDAGMTDREIETEVAQIELTNLLTAGLRKRYPESYRLARRIVVLLQSNRRFRRFGAWDVQGRHVRVVEQVYGKHRQFERIRAVLWHCYLSDEHPTQLAVAASLGVSDSLVSDYRRRIEKALRSLSLTSLEEARTFEEALLARMKECEGANQQSVRPCVPDVRPRPARSGGSSRAALTV